MDPGGQRFGSDGLPTGSQFQLNTYTTGTQDRASVAFHPNGDFVVAWQSDGSQDTDSSNDSVQGQRYGSDGRPLSGEFQINTYTTAYQTNPFVAIDAAGDFLVVWDGDGSSGTDIWGRSIQGQGQQYATPFFHDAFEPGDTSAW